jgi:methyltransferase (TIGR00027 family)
MGRAIADAEGRVRGFSDPIARQLLPAHLACLVDLQLSGRKPSHWRDRALLAMVRRVARVIPLRTVAIDAALRSAPALDQLVILGAGLDARAWRMGELADAIVFEVDHPATQAWKRERTAALPPVAREVRFVPVDFQRDSLDDALAQAGHATGVPTVWIWEGVVRYLSRAAIEATLDAVARRSAPGSRLIANYTLRAASTQWLENLAFRAIGEPTRSSLSTADCAELLAARGFAVLSDSDATEWAAAGSVTLREGERRGWARRRRLVVAERK